MELAEAKSRYLETLEHRKLAKSTYEREEKLWKQVQQQPSSVRFPAGESMTRAILSRSAALPVIRQKVGGRRRG